MGFRGFGVRLPAGMLPSRIGPSCRALNSKDHYGRGLALRSGLGVGISVLFQQIEKTVCCGMFSYNLVFFWLTLRTLTFVVSL